MLHVIPSVAPEHGGPSAALEWMVTGLEERGVDVTVVATNEGSPNRGMETALGHKLLYFPCQTGFYKTSLPLARWIARRIRDFDVLHAHALFSFAPVAACAIARRRGVPYVVRPLGTLNRYGVEHRRPGLKRASLRWIEGPILRRAAAVHFTTDDERRQAVGVGRLDAVVIPHGVPSPTAPPRVLRGSDRPSETRHNVLFLGRLAPEKNLEVLLDAVALARREIPSITIAIAGSGSDDYASILRARAAERGLGDSVAWLGQVAGDLKGAALGEADLFVLPSHSENFGIAAVEAMQAGLPVILSSGVAIAETVEQAGAGISVAPTAGAVAEAVVALLRDPARREAMSARASALARDTYSQDAMCDALVELYGSILGA